MPRHAEPRISKPASVKKRCSASSISFAYGKATAMRRAPSDWRAMMILRVAVTAGTFFCLNQWSHCSSSRFLDFARASA